MNVTISRVDYFCTTVKDQPGAAYRLLSVLEDLGINLVAFAAAPVGPLHTQLTIFPQDTEQLIGEAKEAHLALDGPHPALIVQGDDRLAALADVHMKLYEANVNVYASSGVADGRGNFGYVIYVRPEEYARALTALGL
jgi:hypothetical protein